MPKKTNTSLVAAARAIGEAARATLEKENISANDRIAFFSGYLGVFIKTDIRPFSGEAAEIISDLIKALGYTPPSKGEK